MDYDYLQWYLRLQYNYLPQCCLLLLPTGGEKAVKILLEVTNVIIL